MYANIGSKVKGLAVVIAILGALSSLIGGIVMLKSAPGLAILIIAAGVLSSWIGSWVTYAIGHAAENTDAILTELKKGSARPSNQPNVPGFSPTSTQTAHPQSASNATSAQTINIQEGTIEISPNAFANRFDIKTIVIPGSVTLIGSGAFRSCASLSSIFYRGRRSEWEEVTKGSQWDHGTGNYTVYCLDAEIPKGN